MSTTLNRVDEQDSGLTANRREWFQGAAAFGMGIVLAFLGSGDPAAAQQASNVTLVRPFDDIELQKEVIMTGKPPALPGRQ